MTTAEILNTQDDGGQQCEATAFDDVLESHCRVVRPSLVCMTGSLLPEDFDPFSVVALEVRF